jgi:endonuclease YncB( thermonuclease family)
VSTKTLVFASSLALLAASAWAQDVIFGRVIAVTDGDNIKVLTTENQLLRVRIAWIDAPEMGQAFAVDAPSNS